MRLKVLAEPIKGTVELPGEQTYEKEDAVMDAFGIFYDTDVTIEDALNVGDYSGDTEYEEICRINADIQPNSGGGTQREYGISEDAELVMYCADEGRIKDGMRAVINGKRFIIIGTERRRLGMKVYLKEDIE